MSKPCGAERMLFHDEFVFMNMPCYHCFWRCNKRESKQEVFPCVSNVSVDTVRRHIKELLSAG